MLCLWLILLLCRTLDSAVVQTCATVSQGGFKSVVVPPGLHRAVFIAIPPQSSFFIVQLHSPFNRLLASTVQSFDYEASQYSEHCGLVAKLPKGSTNSTLYIYSPHETNVTAWVRLDAYGPDYAIPGGQGHYISSGFASAALSTVIAELPYRERESNDTSVTLRDWTSILKFTPASLPPLLSESFGTFSNSTPNDYLLTYNLYSTPLVSAGGSYGAYKNPSAVNVADVMGSMASPDASRGTFIHSFTISNDMLSEGMVEIPITRRPGTAFVLKLVVELQGPSGVTRIAYAPTVLYGCQAEKPHKNSLGRAYLARNHSSQLSCGPLPSASPNIYFLVTVLLLASLIYGCCCNLLIWSRCAASVMLLTSFFGTMLYYRYSHPGSSGSLILALSVIFPAILAAMCFIVLWCVCIRPTLQYRRLYGRGPFLKVTETGIPQNSERMEGLWDAALIEPSASTTQLLGDPNTGSSSYFYLHTTEDNYRAVTVEGTQQDAVTDEVGEGVLAIDPPVAAHASCLNCFPSLVDSKRTNKVLSLKPRRLARLTPVLPATLLIVLSSSALLDQYLPMQESKAVYLSFVILHSIIVLCPFFVFKNFAFGLSTALVGVYLSLACACLFCLNNAFLPYLLLEPFLRLTWIEDRLDVIRIEAIGKYDVVMITLWIAVSMALGLCTLFLVRFQDARELSEAQLSRPLLSTIRQPDATAEEPSRSGALWNDAVTFSSGQSRKTSSVLVRAGTGELPHPGSMLSDDASTDPSGVSEHSHLLASAPRAYGGFNSNAPLLVPLSRVQLAAKGRTSRSPRRLNLPTPSPRHPEP